MMFQILCINIISSVESPNIWTTTTQEPGHATEHDSDMYDYSTDFIPIPQYDSNDSVSVTTEVFPKTLWPPQVTRLREFRL